jgi:soluble lytic murein transglycosylase
MQMMPFTAIRVARLMNDHTFELGRLHLPELNIGYGAYYLSKLVEYYDGNMLLAVAAYNAGPTHVDRWLGAYSNLQTDEFVESISFRETRRYVKSVLRNFNQYRNIYAEKQALVSLPVIPKKRNDMELF